MLTTGRGESSSANVKLKFNPHKTLTTRSENFYQSNFDTVYDKFIQLTKVVDTFKVQVQESSSSSTRDVDPRRLPALHFGLELGTCA